MNKAQRVVRVGRILFQRQNRVWIFGVLVCALSLNLTQSSAQTANTGALAGVVSDPSGAVIPGAKVNVTSEISEATRTVITGSGGAYTVPLLPPGSYRVEITKTGFKPIALVNVQINVTETNALNITLTVGNVSQEVTVQAQAEQLQTETSTLGRVTTGEQVNTLPLVTRNYTQIIALNPGVSSEVTNAGELGRGGGQANDVPVSNGGWAGDNNYQMNGVPINDIQSSGNASGGIAIPNPDSIQEFKVQTSQYDASFGRNAGLNLNVITKGGTNEFHGSAWEYFRNDDLNANMFFLNMTGQPRPTLKQNQFGDTFGGPIKRDKLQFFTSYQGTRQRNGVDKNCSGSITLPALTNNRSAAAIGQLFAGQRGVVQNQLGGVGPAIAADGSNISPVALALLNLKLPNGQFVVPTPQTVDLNNPNLDSQGLSAYSVACPYTEDQFVTNADYELSPKSQLYGRFFFSNTATTETSPANIITGGASPPGFPQDSDNGYRNFSLAYNYVFSPTVLNQAEIAYTRINNTLRQHIPFSFSKIGATVPASDNNIPAIAIDFPSFSGLVVGGNGQSARGPKNTFTLQDSISWTHGKHNLRIGGGLARWQNPILNFQFSSQITYLSWADFLLGLNGTDNGTGSSNIFSSLDLQGLLDRNFISWDGNAYVADDFKVTPRLTLNLGFRYDHLGYMGDTFGRNAGFNPALADPNPPAAGTLAGFNVPANYSGAIPAGVTRLDNNFSINGDGQNTWNPRFGFAWQLPHQDRFVLRGGYGVYHTPTTGQQFITLAFEPPFALFRFQGAGGNAAATNQVPISLNVPPIPSFQPYSAATSNSDTFIAPNFRSPILQSYSLGFQAEITKSMVLEAGYSGSRGLHLVTQRSINQALNATPENPIRGETTDTVANIPLRVPFLGWGPDALTDIESTAASWYNALLVSLNKRFSHGLQFQASYTYSKDLVTSWGLSQGGGSRAGGNGGTVLGDQNNPSSKYGPDDFVRPHRLIVNYSYLIPGGNLANPVLRQALSGWQLAGVATFQTGHLLTATYTSNQNIAGISTDVAQLTGTCTPSQYVNPGSLVHKLNSYVNPNCFTTPPVVSADGGVAFGDSGVGIIQGPGQFNWDIALIKRFSPHWPSESANLEFRSEFFNAFNHPQFGDPDTNFGDSTFGQITTTVVAPRIIQFALKLSF